MHVSAGRQREVSCHVNLDTLGQENNETVNLTVAHSVEADEDALKHPNWEKCQLDQLQRFLISSSNVQNACLWEQSDFLWIYFGGVCGLNFGC